MEAITELTCCKSNNMFAIRSIFVHQVGVNVIAPANIYRKRIEISTLLAV